MKILAFEASAKAAGVAVVQDGRILGEAYTDSGFTHSETLMPMCEDLLKTLKIGIKDIDLLAVSAGPGSFTGLRIAQASVKGIMLATGKKCVPVSTLMGLAYNATMVNGVICASMDARCGQVYNALFKAENGKISRICEDRAVAIEEVTEDLKKYSDNYIIFVGDGAKLCYNNYLEVCKSADKVMLAPANIIYQHASSVALAAEELASEAVDEQGLKVIYLRLAQAERERAERLSKN